MHRLHTLLKAWRARAHDALPIDAMLIRKQIRELEEVLQAAHSDESAVDRFAATYWHRAARVLLRHKRELDEEVSGLSEEVLTEGKAHRHWRQVAEDTRDALRDAERYILALEQDREEDRAASYKRAMEHLEARRAGIELEPAANTDLPHIDPAGPGLRTLWFRSRREALAYAANGGFEQAPARRRVWVDLAWRDEWSLRVPCKIASEAQS